MEFPRDGSGDVTGPQFRPPIGRSSAVCQALDHSCTPKGAAETVEERNSEFGVTALRLRRTRKAPPMRPPPISTVESPARGGYH